MQARMGRQTRRTDPRLWVVSGIGEVSVVWVRTLRRGFDQPNLDLNPIYAVLISRHLIRALDVDADS